MSNSFSFTSPNLSDSLKCSKLKAFHISRPSDLTSLRNLQKEKKVKESADFQKEKITSIEDEWTKYKTTKYTPSKISFKKPSKLIKKHSQNDEIIKLATSTVKLLGRKSGPGMSQSSTHKSSKLSSLISSACQEIKRGQNP
jgi:hypothetical protein